jgi:hypothetical protein
MHGQIPFIHGLRRQIPGGPPAQLGQPRLPAILNGQIEIDQTELHPKKNQNQNRFPKNLLLLRPRVPFFLIVDVINDYIGGLDIPMHKTFLIHFVNDLQQYMHNLKRLPHLQFSHFLHVTIETHPPTIIQDNPYLFLIFKDLNQPTHMLAFELPQYVDFIFYEIDIISVFQLFIDLSDFYGPQLPVDFVPCQVNCGKPAPPELALDGVGILQVFSHCVLAEVPAEFLDFDCVFATHTNILRI